ncbi:L-serine ammonia-lyase, iron-sulfur-dependent subunit beta [Paenibacillus montanisoli]|uniref:L-serine deaminase n=1 Tax=Paenibacillus montanisoli TaxID=2081970 RepID=A0A328TXY3_9BACL|nr:L-serine ammonia-lyase, iron-sulfur-dependent subunit beta [Paenibacillus montanisoli]RAP75338.1 L-serine ammonia-lyase, iron-sulfur-dependent, subunit beta [Paenibacillus montanisoli]
MRFKDVFSIIGPSMVGPSSSHTAGAVRIGLVAGQLLGGVPDKAEIIFYGSFAATYQGHGTDVAVVSGLLGFATDDRRIPQALEIAEERGMEISFEQGKGLYSHPNTVKLILSMESPEQRQLSLIGTSIGGGNIEIVEVNEFAVKLTGIYPTLVIRHADRPGVIADLTSLLKNESVNIGHMSVDRKGRSGDALTVLELDGAIPSPLIERINAIANVQQVYTVDLSQTEGSL